MGKPLIRRGINPGALLPAPYWRKGPLIPEDGGCVAHVYWRNGALVDGKGNTWSQNGTVPQVNAAGSTPPAAGPFSAANYYGLGAGADVLDFAGDFSACVILYPTSLGTAGVFYSNTDGSTVGGDAQINAFNRLQFFSRNGGASAQTTNSVTANAPAVCCFGISAGNLLAKLNLGTTVTQAGAWSAAAASVAMLGRWSGGFPYGTGYMIEAYFSSTAGSDALFTSIASTVFSRLRRSP